MASASVFTSVRNISPPLLAGGRLRGAIVARRKPQRERRASSEFAFDGNRAVELFDDALGNGKAEAKPAPLRRDEILENCAETIGGNTGSGVGDGNFNQIADTGCGHDDASARFGRLN